ncbi:MAG: hypothetical protein JST40_03310 [Armatimonadetes bacterium]|nr:hypothetical protein [Armatimonadota bacterium]
MSSNRYSEEEAQEILKESVRIQERLSQGVSSEELLKTASELGISEQALKDAEQQHLRKKSELDEPLFHRDERPRKPIAVMAFAAIMLVLLTVLASTGRHGAPIWIFGFLWFPFFARRRWNRDRYRD